MIHIFWQIIADQHGELMWLLAVLIPASAVAIMTMVGYVHARSRARVQAMFREHRRQRRHSRSARTAHHRTFACSTLNHAQAMRSQTTRRGVASTVAHSRRRAA